jgi:hypothetical protein
MHECTGCASRAQSRGLTNQFLRNLGRRNAAVAPIKATPMSDDMTRKVGTEGIILSSNDSASSGSLGN